jgi:predicted N-formylglutamate amidohydrolase
MSIERPRPQAAEPPSLLAPDEPRPVVVERADSDCPLVLVADHAGRRFPRATGHLGLPPAELDRHIAYDIGIAPVAREVARALGAPLVAQTYSRLVIDCNRPPHVASSIPEVSETTAIPGNRNLPQAAREARIAALFRPYHAAIEAILDARARRGQPTALIALHSFTPVYMGARRPWELGLLYNRDARLGRRVLDLLAHDGTLMVGDNLPYKVDDQTDYTLPVHGEQRGLPHLGFEIRQDLIAETAGQEHWTERIGHLLRQLISALPRAQELKSREAPARSVPLP